MAHGCPARRDAVRKAAGGFQVHAKGQEAKKLHEEKRAVGADLARGEARGKIGGAPGDGAGQSKDYGERNIHRAILASVSLGCRPRTTITFCRSFQTSLFAEDCEADTRDDRWQSVLSRGNRTTRRGSWKCLGWFAAAFARSSCPGADHFRLDHVNLAHQKRRAGGDFVFFRQAIFRRAAFDHVADVNVFAAQAHGFDHVRKEFSGAADEGFALMSSSWPGLRRRTPGRLWDCLTPKTILVRPCAVCSECNRRCLRGCAGECRPRCVRYFEERRAGSAQD